MDYSKEQDFSKEHDSSKLYLAVNLNHCIRIANSIE